MSIRAKLLLVFIVLGLVPMLLLGIGYYRTGTHAVERLLRADVSFRATRLTMGLTSELNERETDLAELARTPVFAAYLRTLPAAAAQTTTQPAAQPPTAGPPAPATTQHAADTEPGAQPSASPMPLTGVCAALESFARRRPDFAAVTFVAAGARPVARVEAPPVAGSALVCKTGDLVPVNTALDERVWSAHEQQPLRSAIMRTPAGTSLRYTVPVFQAASASDTPAGALVAELKLDALLAQLEESATGLKSDPTPELPHFVVVLDRAGQIVYHTNPALKYQPAARALAGFGEIARAMTSGASGTAFFNADDGARWLVAYQPITGLDLSVAVAGDETSAGAGLQLLGGVGIALMFLIALAAIVVLTILVERTSRRIHRVAEAAAQIAAGNLEQRINVKSTDETRLLAESFNLMSDRLREHIAREAESRQFQSFLRLSAMLTHDLKNAITGLSMLVNNMERQYHRAEFREDAISSLRAATDKLRALVARLNEPAQTLSGEYRHAISMTDLVPLIRQALATTAEPARALHQVEINLPEQLFAPVDGERIERVVENLVINALEALGTKRGRLTVTAGTADEQQVFISICDTGVGMSEEFKRKQLFRPFATTKEKGIGLGLYTCREIVHAHGGRLDVQSELGAGTCMRVVLPSTAVKRANKAVLIRSQQTTDAPASRHD